MLGPQGADPSIENARGHTALLGSWNGLTKELGCQRRHIPHASSEPELRWDLTNGEATRAVTGQRHARAADLKVMRSHGDKSNTLPNSEKGGECHTF